MKVLVVCSHPYDETLSMGGTIAKHILQKDDVYLANKLADYYLAHENRITETSVKDFNLAQEYHKRLGVENAT